MRQQHLSDTGRQIEAHIRRTHPGAPNFEAEVDRRDAREAEAEIVERPVHPVAALGATFLVIAGLVIALTLTSLFFIASIIAVPVTIAVVCVLGAWAFWGWEKTRRAARIRLVDPAVNE
jgi:hypothetical protein